MKKCKRHLLSRPLTRLSRPLTRLSRPLISRGCPKGDSLIKPVEIWRSVDLSRIFPISEDTPSSLFQEGGSASDVKWKRNKVRFLAEQINPSEIVFQFCFILHRRLGCEFEIAYIVIMEGFRRGFANNGSPIDKENSIEVIMPRQIRGKENLYGNSNPREMSKVLHVTKFDFMECLNSLNSGVLSLNSIPLKTTPSKVVNLRYVQNAMADELVIFYLCLYYKYPKLELSGDLAKQISKRVKYETKPPLSPEERICASNYATRLNSSTKWKVHFNSNRSIIQTQSQEKGTDLLFSKNVGHEKRPLLDELAESHRITNLLTRHLNQRRQQAPKKTLGKDIYRKVYEILCRSKNQSYKNKNHSFEREIIKYQKQREARPETETKFTEIEKKAWLFISMHLKYLNGLRVNKTEPSKLVPFLRHFRIFIDLHYSELSEILNSDANFDSTSVNEKKLKYLLIQSLNDYLSPIIKER